MAQTNTKVRLELATNGKAFHEIKRRFDGAADVQGVAGYLGQFRLIQGRLLFEGTFFTQGIDGAGLKKILELHGAVDVQDVKGEAV